MDAFDGEPPSDHELTVVDCATRGQPAVFPGSPDGKPPIRAAVIRALLLGQSIASPQPYRQLTHVLRPQGHENAARNISIYEQWATPRHNWLAQLLYDVYGACFGFGLWPKRAACALLAYVCLGWLFAVVALEWNLLVETPQIAATSYTVDQVGAAKRAFVLANGSRRTQPELDCSDVTDPVFDTLVYAVDTVLPFIPLHQETKCELRPQWHFLRFARALYTVFGWIVTSLALLTFSGIVRRFDGDAR